MSVVYTYTLRDRQKYIDQLFTYCTRNREDKNIKQQTDAQGDLVRYRVDLEANLYR